MKKNRSFARKEITMSQPKVFHFEETKGERFARKYGGSMCDVFFIPMTILCGFLSGVFRVIGSISSVLILAGIYYSYKTYTVVKAGYEIAHNGYLMLAVTFICVPFIAIFISVVFRALKEYFGEKCS